MFIETEETQLKGRPRAGPRWKVLLDLCKLDLFLTFTGTCWCLEERA